MNLKDTLISNKTRLVGTFDMLKDKFLYLEKRNATEPKEWLKKEMQEVFEATEAIRLYSESSDRYIAFFESYLNEQLEVNRFFEAYLSNLEFQTDFKMFNTIAELQKKMDKKGFSKDQIELVKSMIANFKKSHATDKA